MFWRFEGSWDKARGTGNAGRFKKEKSDQSNARKSKMFLRSKFRNVSYT
jgi:hypothetical protein